MKPHKVNPIVWPLPGATTPTSTKKELQKESKDRGSYLPPELRPLKPARGRLKELENKFINAMQKKQHRPQEWLLIIQLFDLYKRKYPDNDKLDELERLIFNVNTIPINPDEI